MGEGYGLLNLDMDIDQTLNTSIRTLLFDVRSIPCMFISNHPWYPQSHSKGAGNA